MTNTQNYDDKYHFFWTVSSYYRNTFCIYLRCSDAYRQLQAVFEIPLYRPQDLSRRDHADRDFLRVQDPYRLYSSKKNQKYADA